MDGKIKYQFSAKLWKHTASGGWHFVSLPVTLAVEIRSHLKWQEEGWGRLKAKAKIGEYQWDTAIWYDTKHATYLLPIKADIRKKENMDVDSTIAVTVWI